MKKRSIKKYLIIGGGSFGLLVGLFFYLLLDGFYTANFRSVTDRIPSTHHLDLNGLRELQASGGNLVRFPDLSRRLSHFKGPKIIVDAMAEFHGYINGIPTTFFAYQRKTPNLKHLARRWILTGTFQVQRDLVTLEKEEAQKYGFEYKAVNIGSSYIEISKNIDEILDFFEKLPQNVWLHFHCARGKGRTTILLVMLDILKNSPKVTLNDIIQRHYLLGSENLFDTTVWKKGTYDKKMLDNRKKFIEDFYEFVCQRKVGGMQLWSEWIRQK